VEPKSKHDNYIDKAISDIKAFLKEHPSKVPHIISDPKGTTISIKYNFGHFDDLKIKLKAERDDWLNLWADHDFEHVQFKEIEPYLSRRVPKETKEILKKYSEDYPDHFSADVFDCIQWIINEIPSYRPPKPRKPSVYGLDKKEKWEISSTAVRLYLYLLDIGRLTKESWPPFLKKFVDTYKIPVSNNGLLLNLKDHINLKDDIRDIMVKYYGIDFGDRFWKTFVTESPISLTRIKHSKRRINPENDPFLEELFKEFQS
jgi:hypothetical protein